ncbi:hypothetical protein Tco_0768742 [Tanacetum coccineum]
MPLRSALYSGNLNNNEDHNDDDIRWRFIGDALFLTTPHDEFMRVMQEMIRKEVRNYMSGGGGGGGEGFRNGGVPAVVKRIGISKID